MVPPLELAVPLMVMEPPVGTALSAVKVITWVAVLPATSVDTMLRTPPDGFVGFAVHEYVLEL